VDLSVIIPCHNEAGTVVRQLDALAGQSWDGSWEVIVVDNRSTDGTAEIAAAHTGLRGRLRVVRADAASGVSYARAAGVEASSARTVAFCDGDDVVGDGWVSAMGEALLQHELVTGEIEVDELNEPAIAASRGTRRSGMPPTYGSVTFLRGNNGGMWRSTWDTLGGFDREFHGLEDIELSLRAAAQGRLVHFEPAALVHYRHRDDWPGLWKQGIFYGGSEPMLRRRSRALGLEPRGRAAGWRSWAWLVLHAPGLLRPSTRPRWVWTLACRVGAIKQGVRSALRV
jgi:glycosyltransferase involved in cell wall biosynthesis